MLSKFPWILLYKGQLWCILVWDEGGKLVNILFGSGEVGFEKEVGGADIFQFGRKGVGMTYFNLGWGGGVKKVSVCDPLPYFFLG